MLGLNLKRKLLDRCLIESAAVFEKAQYVVGCKGDGSIYSVFMV
jgi:hypothetical protein